MKKRSLVIRISMILSIAATVFLGIPSANAGVIDNVIGAPCSPSINTTRYGSTQAFSAASVTGAGCNVKIDALWVNTNGALAGSSTAPATSTFHITGAAKRGTTVYAYFTVCKYSSCSKYTKTVYIP
ncbi:MAG: hypothetical protein U0R17_03580 [Acidimicrobiia bacterium]